MKKKISISTTLIFTILIFEFIMDPVPNSVEFSLIGFLASYVLIWLYAFRFGLAKNNVFLLVIFLISFSMMMAISLAKGVVVVDIIRGILPFFLMFTFFPISILLINNKLKVKNFNILIYIYGLLYSFNNIYLFLQNEFFSPNKTFRITSIDQNTISSVPLFLAVLSFYQYFNSKGRTNSLLTFTSFLIATLAILVTLTRSLLISLVVFIIIIIFLQFKKMNMTVIKKMIWMLILSSLGLIIIVKKFSQTNIVLSIQSRLMGLLSNDGNVSARLDEYILALDMFRENPILGGGIGVRFSERAGSEVNYVHNSVMYILANLGLTGLIVITISLGIFIYVTCRLKDKMINALLLSVLSILFFSLFFATYKWISHNLLIGLSIGVLLYRMRVPNDIK